MIKIGVVGCGGRMGRFILQAIHEANGCDVGGGSVRPGNSLVDQPMSQLINGYEALKITDSNEALFQKSSVVIDFTTAGSTAQHVELAQAHKTPLVIGTTGFSDADDLYITEAAQFVPILQAFNMSVGIALMNDLVERVAGTLDDRFDIEVFEMHHARKKDAPSGTGLGLGRAAARGRGVALKEPIDLDRNTLRQKGDIGFSVARGGGVAGDHSVSFTNEAEMLTLSHRAFSPDIFAHGAVTAAQWVVVQKPGRYDMKDVLGLNPKDG